MMALPFFVLLLFDDFFDAVDAQTDKNDVEQGIEKHVLDQRAV